MSDSFIGLKNNKRVNKPKKYSPLSRNLKFYALTFLKIALFLQ